MMKRKAYDCTRNCEQHFDREGVACSKDSLSEDISERRLLMDLGNILNYARWVVGFRVYIEWDVSWLRKGSVCTVL